MRIILLEDVKGTGKKDDIVEVKDGFARNYLLPKGLAREATQAIEAETRRRHEQERLRQAKEQAHFRALADQLKGSVVRIGVRAGESGRLFGAVTNADIAAALASAGYEVDRKKILSDAIRHVGDHPVTIRLYRDIETEIIVRVEPQ